MDNNVDTPIIKEFDSFSRSASDLISSGIWSSLKMLMLYFRHNLSIEYATVRTYSTMSLSNIFDGDTSNNVNAMAHAAICKTENPMYGTVYCGSF